jgi:hypothetical protein
LSTPTEMADYYSVIAKAVSALDLNTGKARLRLYERARTAIRSEMHSAYPPFHRSEIAAAEMSLEMAIEAVEAEATCDQNARLATLSTSSLRAGVSVMPSLPANHNGEARRSLSTLWAGIFGRAGDGAQGRGEQLSGHCEDDTDSRERRDTWLTELLARASHGVDNDEQDFAPRQATTQNGRVN